VRLLGTGASGGTPGRGRSRRLRADQALPVVCRWRVERIVLTQIGRTAPAHEQLERRVHALCARARPGWDGLELRLPERARGGGAAGRE
jgi:hypothetical protein